MASKRLRRGSVTFKYVQSAEDFSLSAQDTKGAELLGIIYDWWEREKLDLGSFGPAATNIAVVLMVNNKDQFAKQKRKVRRGK